MTHRLQIGKHVHHDIHGYREPYRLRLLHLRRRHPDHSTLRVHQGTAALPLVQRRVELDQVGAEFQPWQLPEQTAHDAHRHGVVESERTTHRQDFLTDAESGYSPERRRWQLFLGESCPQNGQIEPWSGAHDRRDLPTAVVENGQHTLSVGDHVVVGNDQSLLDGEPAAKK